MESLHPPCTPLKNKYDSCFNHWFDEYLRLAAPQRPPTALTPTSSHANENNKSAEERQGAIRKKAEEYETRCGETWRAYRSCLQAGLHEKDLNSLLSEAREEFPLKKPADVDMDA